MPESTLIFSLSGPLQKALLVNRASQPFDLVLPSATRMRRTSGSIIDDDGIPVMTNSGVSTPNSLILFPYCDGVKGSQFSMRLWGTRALADHDPSKLVYLPYLLAEYFCTAASFAGPADGNYFARALLPTENLCDSIQLTHGALGPQGVIVSPATDVVPGPDLTAWVMQGIFGSQKVYFDFQPENGFNGTMNCLYARA